MKIMIIGSMVGEVENISINRHFLFFLKNIEQKQFEVLLQNYISNFWILTVITTLKQLCISDSTILVPREGQ